MEFFIDTSKYINQINNFINLIPKFTEHNKVDNSKGVIICAGDLHFISAILCIENLIKQNNSLEIEWYYCGNELYEFQKQFIKSNYPSIHLIDFLTILPEWFPEKINSIQIKGYMIKPFALMMSKFNHVLLLDADIIPLIDINEFFNCEHYLKYGNVFWPDVKFDTKELNDRMLQFGIKPYQQLKIKNPYDFNYELAETGQILINREKCWNAICLSYYLNYHNEIWYKLFFGDKDLYFIAFQLTNTFYYQNQFRPIIGTNKNNQFGKLTCIIQLNPINGSDAFIHNTLSKINVNKYEPIIFIYRNSDYQVLNKTGNILDINLKFNNFNEELKSDYSIGSNNNNHIIEIEEKNIKFINDILRPYYKENITFLLEKYKESIISNVSYSKYLFDVRNIKQLEMDLLSLSIYLNNNTFHLNGCVIYYFIKEDYKNGFDTLYNMYENKLNDEQTILILVYGLINLSKRMDLYNFIINNNLFKILPDSDLFLIFLKLLPINLTIELFREKETIFFKLFSEILDFTDITPLEI